MLADPHVRAATVYYICKSSIHTSFVSVTLKKA